MKSDVKSKGSADPFPSKNRRRLRWLVRASALVAAILALWPVTPDTSLPVLVPALSPFVAAGSLIATHALSSFVWLGLAVGLIALVRPRWFCRWVCPIGLCADGATRVGRRFGRPPLRGPLWGQWFVLLTLGGAVLGYPLLLWLDPLAIFAGVVHSRTGNGGFAPWTSLLVFVALLLLSLLWTNAWCGRICPLGAFQDLLFSWKHHLRTTLSRKEKKTGKTTGPALSRRTALAAAAGLVWVGIMGRLRSATARPLRPPGARGEGSFSGVCTRCGNCLQVCPSRIIEHDVATGIASLLTPVVSFREDYCREDCALCTKVCPSGALRQISPKNKMDAPIGIAKVDMDICLLRDDRECTICQRRCPYDAIRYVFSEKDYMTRPEITPEKCPGCGACEAACPTSPKKAIAVFPR